MAVSTMDIFPTTLEIVESISKTKSNTFLRPQFDGKDIRNNIKGFEQSNSKAREWWTKSAAQGHKDAINGLNELDELGV